MTTWISAFLAGSHARSDVASPPFVADQRIAAIMNAVWHGRTAPQDARAQARQLGFSDRFVEAIIEEATRPPSLCEQPHGDEQHPTAAMDRAKR